MRNRKYNPQDHGLRCVAIFGVLALGVLWMMLTGCFRENLRVPIETPHYDDGFFMAEVDGKEVVCQTPKDFKETFRYISESCTVCHPTMTPPYPTPKH